MASMKRLKIGMYLSIPLADGRFAYAQYLYYDKHEEGVGNPPKHGYLIQVFDLITDREFTIEELGDPLPLFPPVFTIPQIAVRQGRWHVIGWRPVEHFIHPTFRWGSEDNPDRPYRHWRIWDGVICTMIGLLPPELKKLEDLCIWNAIAIEDRITSLRPAGEKGKTLEPSPQTIQATIHNAESINYVDEEEDAEDTTENEQAVLLVIPQTGEFDSDFLLTLEPALATALDEAGKGEFDGNEFSTSDVTLFFYGPNADVLATIMKPVLCLYTFPPGATLTKRYGPAGSREVTQDLQEFAQS